VTHAPRVRGASTRRRPQVRGPAPRERVTAASSTRAARALAAAFSALSARRCRRARRPPAAALGQLARRAQARCAPDAQRAAAGRPQLDQRRPRAPTDPRPRARGPPRRRAGPARGAPGVGLHDAEGLDALLDRALGDDAVTTAPLGSASTGSSAPRRLARRGGEGESRAGPHEPTTAPARTRAQPQLSARLRGLSRPGRRSR
jgi:hypothetical protein